MPRPDFPFPGAWLGRDNIWVHMAPRRAQFGPLLQGTPPHAARATNTGVVDHIAFAAADLTNSASARRA